MAGARRSLVCLLLVVAETEGWKSGKWRGKGGGHRGGGAAAAPSPEDFSDFILNDVCVGEHVLELLRAQDIGSIETLRMLNLDDLRAIPGLALGPRRKLHETITELRDGGVT